MLAKPKWPTLLSRTASSLQPMCHTPETLLKRRRLPEVKTLLRSPALVMTPERLGAIVMANITPDDTDCPTERGYEWVR